MGTIPFSYPTIGVKREEQSLKAGPQKSCFKILFDDIAILSNEQHGLLPGDGEQHNQFILEVAPMKKEIKEVKKTVMEQIEAMDVEELKRVLDFLAEMKQQKEQGEEISNH